MSWHYLQGEAGASLPVVSSDFELFALWRSIRESGQSSSTDRETEPCRRSPSGMISEPSTLSRGEESSRWSREGSLVRTSACASGAPRVLPESDPDCGRKWPGLFAIYNHGSRSWKTPQFSLLGGLEEFSATWPKWGWMRDGECFPLPYLDAPIIDTGFSWLLTPMAQSRKAWTVRNPYALIRKNHADGNLQEQLMRRYRRMTTPECQEILMCWPEGWTGSKPLAPDGFRRWLREQFPY